MLAGSGLTEMLMVLTAGGLFDELYRMPMESFALREDRKQENELRFDVVYLVIEHEWEDESGLANGSGAYRLDALRIKLGSREDSFHISESLPISELIIK